MNIAKCRGHRKYQLGNLNGLSLRDILQRRFGSVCYFVSCIQTASHSNSLPQGVPICGCFGVELRTVIRTWYFSMIIVTYYYICVPDPVMKLVLSVELYKPHGHIYKFVTCNSLLNRSITILINFRA